jgi:hypothetical protein
MGVDQPWDSLGKFVRIDLCSFGDGFDDIDGKRGEKIRRESVRGMHFFPQFLQRQIHKML